MFLKRDNKVRSNYNTLVCQCFSANLFKRMNPGQESIAGKLILYAVTL